MFKQVNPYLSFDGNAKEALDFYADAFDAEIFAVQTYGEANFPTPDEAAERIMHARLRKDALLLYFSDAFPGQEVHAGNNYSIVLEFESKEEQEKVYAKLIEGGKAFMELQETFWGAIYAKVQDKFGYIWELNFEVPKS